MRIQFQTPNGETHIIEADKMPSDAEWHDIITKNGWDNKKTAAPSREPFHPPVPASITQGRPQSPIPNQQTGTVPFAQTTLGQMLAPKAAPQPSPPQTFQGAIQKAVQTVKSAPARNAKMQQQQAQAKQYAYQQRENQIQDSLPGPGQDPETQMFGGGAPISASEMQAATGGGSQPLPMTYASSNIGGRTPAEEIDRIAGMLDKFGVGLPADIAAQGAAIAGNPVSSQDVQKVKSKMGDLYRQHPLLGLAAMLANPIHAFTGTVASVGTAVTHPDQLNPFAADTPEDFTARLIPYLGLAVHAMGAGQHLGLVQKLRANGYPADLAADAVDAAAPRLFDQSVYTKGLQAQEGQPEAPVQPGEMPKLNVKAKAGSQVSPPNEAIAEPGTQEPIGGQDNAKSQQISTAPDGNVRKAQTPESQMPQNEPPAVPRVRGNKTQGAKGTIAPEEAPQNVAGINNAHQEAVLPKYGMDQPDKIGAQTVAQRHAVASEAAKNMSLSDFEGLAKNVRKGMEENPQNVAIIKHGNAAFHREADGIGRQLAEAVKAGDQGRAGQLRDEEATLTGRWKGFLDDVQAGKGNWAYMGHEMAQGIDIDHGNMAQVVTRAALDGKPLIEGTPEYSKVKKLTDEVASSRQRIAELEKAETDRQVADMAKKAAPKRAPIFSQEELDAELKDILAHGKNVINRTGSGTDKLELLGVGAKLMWHYAKRGINSVDQLVAKAREHLSALGARHEDISDQEFKNAFLSEKRAQDAIGRSKTRQEGLKQQVESGVITPPKIRVPIDSPELRRARAKEVELKRSVQQILDSRKPKSAKFLENLARYERGNILLSPTVAGKLPATSLVDTAADLASSPFSAIAQGLSPSLRENVQAEKLSPSSTIAGAKAAFGTEGLKASYSWNAVKNLFRSGETDVDQYARDAMGKVAKQYHPVLEAATSLHKLLKTSRQRSVFYSALDRVSKAMKTQGVDVDSPAGQVSVIAKAYEESNRGIYLNPTWLSDKIDKGLGDSPQGKAVARILVPISRVGVNIAGRGMEYMGGLPYGAAIRMKEALLGRKIDPDTADRIVRAYKRGGLGAAMMVAGYMNPKIFGGFYTADTREKKPGQRAAAGEPGFDQVGNLPRWLTHSPIFLAAQGGATLRRIGEKYGGDMGKAIQHAIPEILGAVGEQTPYVEQGMQAAEFPVSHPKGYENLGRMATGLLVPGSSALGFAARQMDNNRKVQVQDKKNPAMSAVNAVKEALPGARQTLQSRVPPKSMQDISDTVSKASDKRAALAKYIMAHADQMDKEGVYEGMFKAAAGKSGPELKQTLDKYMDDIGLGLQGRNFRSHMAARNALILRNTYEKAVLDPEGWVKDEAKRSESSSKAQKTKAERKEKIDSFMSQ